MFPAGMFAVVAAAVIGLQKLGEKSDELAVKKRDNNIDLRKKETKRSEIYSTWDEKKLKNQVTMFNIQQERAR